mgnify:CR=1 FL=1
MIKYKLDIVSALDTAGYNPRKIRTEKLISEGTMSKIRRGDPISFTTIDTICRLLNCQPGDLLEYVPD